MSEMCNLYWDNQKVFMNTMSSWKFGLDKAPHSLLRKSKARGMMVAQSYSSCPVKFSTFPVQDSYFQNILHC